jgi:hypothetical protein
MSAQQSRFFHHPDSVIVIEGDDSSIGRLEITLTEFLTYEPEYSLPPGGYTAQEYLPNIRHTLYKGPNQFGAPLPDATLQGYINNVANYIARHKNPPRTLEQALAAKLQALANLSGAKKLGHILLFGKEFYSTDVNVNQIIQYQIAGIVPQGFYYTTVEGEQVPLDLTQLLVLNAGIVKLHLLCNWNRDAIALELNTLTTVEEIDNFNIATNADYPWPIVPYTPA